jgi:hypothetical protein
MGLLQVHKMFFEDEKGAEILLMSFDWLKRECKATYKECTTLCDQANGIHVFRVEGEDIPEGEKQFDLMTTEVVKGVYSFNVS